MPVSSHCSFVLRVEQLTDRVVITLQNVRSRERLELASWEELVGELQRSLSDAVDAARDREVER